MELKCKMVIIGDTQVGKTSILNRYHKNEFDHFQTTTIGSMSYNRMMKIGHKRVNLSIWDTAGQERYRSIATSQFKGVQIFVLVYDTTEEGTIKNLNYWLDAIENHADCENVIFIVGNKVDLLEQYEQQIPEDVKSIMQQYDIQHIFVSAKENIRISDIFDQTTNIAMEKGIIEKYNEQLQQNDWTDLETNDSKVKSKSCC